ncbi:actin-related protein 2/3 complex subunit 5 [Baffinella frigidus]|nr:actin-related protein 2/3 complex subunit 5 [Cryptophyta sp. CCMP2293]|mmetsp:Transcript_58164/g.138453  ORF Transcript_58164/g.138453 Transcript_58164/m.138453 type:complete len:117 (-) Transcript_58164:41-391(-)|eukprot:CAMPEP_0180150220 /NCGR_PEP_ID=MMETSP0986-20121125/21320_1 /TAXON_ID=697907 /ORGANISM="non described non described, Strain CCMP2293" /LENGTH=116 /DNA_ID=CAMNT_0022097115 /DNA_START=174 /DNA_END=524 /DNA_ORIENTATION=-
MEAVTAREKQVAALLANPTAAVKASLVDPPYGCPSEDVRRQSGKVVVKAIGAVAKKDIVGVIEGLSGEEQDALMKYLYRGLAEKESCAQLLEWHGVLAEKAGMGCIMRALADRRAF